MKPPKKKSWSAVEASLPTDCPGYHMSTEQADLVQAGQVDYLHKRGWGKVVVWDGIASYAPKRPMRAKQAEAFRLSAEAAAFELGMEQRTGKTKVIVDTCAYQFRRFLEMGGRALPPRGSSPTALACPPMLSPVPGPPVLAATGTKPLAGGGGPSTGDGLNGLLVVAMPGRVHRNWAHVGFPEDWPDDLPWKGLVWDAGKAAQKGFQADADQTIRTKGFSLVAVNGEAIITQAFRAWLPRWLRARGRVMVCADEHTLIMAGWGKRTKVMLNIAKRPEVVMRRILDGTPHGDTPLSTYYPWKFLDQSILGFSSPVAFRHHHAKWSEGIAKNRKGELYKYPVIERDDDDRPIYQNLDELRKKKAPYTFRVLRKDCWDVPDKVYQIHPFQLAPQQRHIYDELKTKYAAEFADGSSVTARHALTRYLRLQQVCSNYWPPETVAQVHAQCGGAGCPGCEDLGVVVGKTPLKRIAPLNPRVVALREILELNPDAPTLVWARFHEDIDQVLGLAEEMGRSHGQYDGRVDGTHKDLVNDQFQKGVVDFVVGHPRSGGRGANFSRAKLIVYYSNEFSLLSRLQSEDRAEAEGKKDGTGIVDLVAENTLDDDVIIPALRAKREIADYVMGERRGKWL